MLNGSDKLSGIKEKAMSMLPAVITVSALLTLGGVSHAVATADSAERTLPAAEAAVECVTTTTAASTTASTTTSKTTTTSTTAVTTSTTEQTTSTETVPATETPTASPTTAAATEAATESPTEAERPVYSFDYTSAGVSPNSSYYQDRIVIFGDSIGYGFNAYGYVPFEHNLAKENVGVWNLGNFTFDKGGGEMSMIDNVGYVDPALIYISLGMNDVNGFSVSGFAADYRSIVDSILEKVPDTTVVVGAITPVSESCGFVSNDVIREYNSALENMVSEINSPQVLFFDAYTVLADPYTLALPAERSGGDGIHLGSGSYSDLFTVLFSYLDTTSAADQIAKHDGY